MKLSTSLAILLIILFGLGYILLVIPYLQNSEAFASLPYVEQYVIYNLGIYALFSGVFGTIAAAAVYRRVNVPNVLLAGLAVFIFESWFFDEIQPPFYLNTLGQVAVQANVSNVEGTAVDAMWASVFQPLLGNTPALWWAVYVAVPILALALFVAILGQRRFLRLFGVKL